MIQQRTPEWYKAREGRFTASEFGDIMTNPADKSAAISKTAMKCISRAASEWKGKYFSPPEPDLKQLFPKLGRWMDGFKGEMIFSDEKLPIPVQWGIDHEAAALRLFRKTTNWNIMDGGFLVHNTMDDIGATPDAVVLEDEECIATVQVKCPYNRSIHRKYLEKIVDAESLKKVNRKYYWQVQGEMWVFDVRQAWFVSFDPRARIENQMHYVKILRNDADLEVLKERLLTAMKIRDEKVKDMIDGWFRMRNKKQYRW